MNEIKTSSEFGEAPPTAPTDPRTEPSPAPREQTHTRSKRGLLGAGVVLALAGGLGYGGWRDYATRQDAAAVVRQRLDFVPTVQVAPVRASADTIIVSLLARTGATWTVGTKSRRCCMTAAASRRAV